MTTSKHLEFPIIYVSKPGTLEEKILDPSMPDVIVYSFFVSTGNRKVLLIHGNERGSLPDISREAIERFNPDYIYCCYAKTVRWATGDNRVVGNHDTPTMYKHIKIGDQQVMFTIDIKEE